jgi:hypothetical protein
MAKKSNLSWGDCIVRFRDKSTKKWLYSVTVGIQDGVEVIGNYPTLKKAQEAWVDAQKILNNKTVKPTDVPLVTEMDEVINGTGLPLYGLSQKWYKEEEDDYDDDDEIYEDEMFEDDEEEEKPKKVTKKKAKKKSKKKTTKKAKKEIVPFKRPIDLDVE